MRDTNSGGFMQKELPARKNIRLRGYDYSINGAYEITICTHNREHIWGEIVGATLCGRPNNPHIMVEKWISETENKFGDIQIDKYIIMPNHIHMIIFLRGNDGESGDHAGSPLPRIIEWFKTMTTNEYIRGVKSGIYPAFSKRIWQRNYYEHIIRNDDEYNKIWQYIDKNPAKWTEDKYFV